MYGEGLAAPGGLNGVLVWNAEMRYRHVPGRQVRGRLAPGLNLPKLKLGGGIHGPGIHHRQRCAIRDWQSV